MAKKLRDLDELFKGRHVERELIILCVRWYCRYKLSYRDLVEMMVERGLHVAHTTIMRWVQRYVPDFEKRWARYARKTCRSWRVDLLPCFGRARSNPASNNDAGRTDSPHPDLMARLQRW